MVKPYHTKENRLSIKGFFNQVFKKKNTVEVFSEIYQKKTWNGHESFSGRGSDLDQTRVLRHRLPSVIRELGVKTILDLPCGDFHWMSEVVAAVSDLDYTGGDIVSDLVASNNQKHSSNRVKFKTINLISDTLPPADLLICRDCLVHLSEEDISRALNNIAASNYKYVALTSFDETFKNRKIETGKWRPLNLLIDPFNFPTPLIKIIEECTEVNGKYRDKNLSIFEFKDLFVK